MQKNSDVYSRADLQYIVGKAEIAAHLETVKPLKVFDDRVIEFLDVLSKRLVRRRAFSDVVTFGYWCRKAALIKEKEKYDDANKRLGRGIVFHIAPSNVAVNFAFSFASGLLAGNANVVRLPSKDFEQIDIICDEVKDLLEGEFYDLSPYLIFIRYPYVKEITDAFSAIATTRVIWGGDRTIATIRQSALKARANEITFADRHSLAVIDSNGYLAMSDKKRVAQKFYNDTFFSDQNACTSPRIIVWLGKENEKEKAKAEFWKYAYELVKERYSLAPVQSVNKLSAFYKTAAFIDVQRVKDGITDDDSLIYRIKVEKDELSVLMDFKYNSGFFFEYDAEDISDILPLCTESCQTITYCGVDKTVFKKLINAAPMGVDRIVPFGESMDFSLIWDGHDLIREMSRRVTVI